MTRDPRYYLDRIRKRFLLIKSVEIFMYGLSLALLCYAVCELQVVKTNTQLVVSIVVGVNAMAGFFFLFRLNEINTGKLTSYLNERYAALEASSDLLVRESADLTTLEQLQRERVAKTFETIYPEIRLPGKLGRSFLILFVSVGLSLVLVAFTPKVESSIAVSSVEDKIKKTTTPPLPVSVTSLKITVTPPAYTRVKSTITSNPDLELPEGSNVTWKIVFSDPIENARLVLSEGDSISLERSGNRYTGQKTFSKSSFYQIQWTNTQHTTRTSDYYKIELIEDQAPEITIADLPQFTELGFTDNLKVPVRSNLQDDYGLTYAYAIATVSKGSGESVKFREERLSLTTPSKIEGKKISASLTLDLLKLGLEPGDELYFYIEAIDNKIPTANRARTETFFIALRDTASQSLSIEGGLGVDLMPEYFRSQRQIIIDSEKLLREKKVISKQEFNARSNELGYDQKVLRLKYGEFLGEEFESAIGPGAALPVEDTDHNHEEGESNDIVKKYSHVHDSDNEHNLVPEKKPEHQGHDHGNELDPEKKDDDPRKAYMHVHDDPEEATFFTQSIRAKLKAALTVMWDAELHLRLFDPEKSLPYQYQALKLLKEISNDSRIYVHKTGFDPPPLKEDKRLTGDLSEVKSSRGQFDVAEDETYPAMREALTIIENVLTSVPSLPSEKEKQVMRKAGQELSVLALEQPGRYLTTLSRIKTLTEENILDAGQRKTFLISIRRDLWSALPTEQVNPIQTTTNTHGLNEIFIKKLETLKDE